MKVLLKYIWSLIKTKAVSIYLWAKVMPNKVVVSKWYFLLSLLLFAIVIIMIIIKIL